MTPFIKKVLEFTKTPQGVFVWAGSFFGLLFLILIPPFQTPDEMMHFLRAYEIASFKPVSMKKDGVTGDYLPKSIDKTGLAVHTEIAFHPEAKYKVHDTREALTNISLDENNVKFYGTAAASIYSPVGYLPQSLAIFIGKIFHAPPLLLLYLARLAILMAWVGLIFASVKLMPFKKWAVVAIALFPMVVAQSISIGVDAISIGTMVLFIAAVLKGRQSKKISKGLLVTIACAAVAMVLSKQTFILLLPLVFLVRKGSFGTIKRPLLCKLLIVGLPLLLYTIWTFLSGDVGRSATQVANHQDTHGQISFLMQHPLHFLRAFFDTFFFSYGDSVVNSVVGNFGWMDTPLPAFAVAFGYAVLAILLVCGYRETSKVDGLTKWLLLGLGALYTAATCGALYVIYSPVGFNIIVGLQGRYFLPVLFLLIPVLYGIAQMTKRAYVGFALASTLFLLIVSTVTLCLRYYIEYKF